MSYNEYLSKKYPYKLCIIQNSKYSNLFSILKGVFRVLNIRFALYVEKIFCLTHFPKFDEMIKHQTLLKKKKLPSWVIAIQHPAYIVQLCIQISHHK